MPVSISVIIPSISGPYLSRTLDSIKQQELIETDQIIVVGDGPQPAAEQLVKGLGHPFEYLEAPKLGNWGNGARNFAIPYTKGDYLCWIDEDDIFTIRSFSIIREQAELNPNRPLLFRFETPGRLVLWAYMWDFGLARTGGHQFVAPNNPAMLGRWFPENDYCADFRFIDSTLAFYPNGIRDLVWVDHIIAITRPHTKGL